MRFGEAFIEVMLCEREKGMHVSSQLLTLRSMCDGGGGDGGKECRRMPSICIVHTVGKLHDESMTCKKYLVMNKKRV